MASLQNRSSQIKMLRAGTLYIMVAITVSLYQVSSSPIPNVTSTSDGDELAGLYTMFGGNNPRVTPDGRTIVEGDIVQPIESEYTDRKATPEARVYWPNGEIVYTYHNSIRPGEMAVIEAAIQHWRQHTCLTFRQRQMNDYLFVQFRSDTPGCWSLVGRQTERPGQGQDVSIGAGCANLNVVVHEIGHVIGFYHEQSRSDRDQHINIVWDNVLPGYSLQFRRETDASYNIPYDYTSTMQYPQWAFSKELFEKSTIVALDPKYQRFLSKNYPLSFRDKKLANLMYQCARGCPNSPNTCQNGGYLRPYRGDGAPCTCECPPNFQGANCETQTREDYYEPLPCGGVVKHQGRIQTPNFPQRLAPHESCTWDIQAPSPHQRVSIKFEGFEFAPRFTKEGTKVINKCFNETVEIRLKNNDIYNGDFYCGSDIAPGTVLKSDGPRAVIIITANDKMIGQGLKAKVRFTRRFGDENEINDDKDDDDNDDDGQTTTMITQLTTELPIVSPEPSTVVPPAIIQTLPPVFTFPPINTIRPEIPDFSTTSSLLEEYEKESKKTLPPIMPPY